MSEDFSAEAITAAEKRASEMFDAALASVNDDADLSKALITGFEKMLAEWNAVAAQATPGALLVALPPVVLLLAVGLLGHFGWPRRDAPRPTWEARFRRVDLLVIPALAGVALAQMFEAGRLVMLAAPLFVVPAAAVLLHRLAGKPAGEAHPQ